MRRIAVTTAVGALMLVSGTALASSHREAPFLTEQPKVDGTDFYMFRSYEAGREGFVTIIADYQPFQEPFGGPNYFFMDPDALYEIHIDNNGDAKEDITFQFRFNNDLSGNRGLGVQAGNQAVPIAFPAAGPIDSPEDRATRQHILETYTLQVVRNGRRSGAAQDVTKPGGVKVFEKPFDNIGSKTFPSYTAYSRSFIFDAQIPDCNGMARVFVGQRKEPFAVNVGAIFDLVNAPPEVITDPSKRDAAPNPLANKNITSLALEVPIACLTAAADKPIIAGWTTASLRQARVLNPKGTFEVPSREGGAWTQVSRLGMPLVNEVVIGIADKDLWNNSEPSQDAQFLTYVTNPTVPVLIETIFSGALRAPPTPRNDLVTVFLKGVPNVNENGATAEYLRLNTANIPNKPLRRKGEQNSLGAAGCFNADKQLDLTPAACDPYGFPNGRRPGDDVTDIELTVAMGYLIKGALPDGVIVHDAVLQSDAQFDDTFPYLRSPIPGAGSQN